VGEAVALAEAAGYRRIYGIGGAGIYGEMLRLADRLLITEVDVEVDGADTWFPQVDMAQWRVLGESVLREDGPGCRVVEMVKKLD
jgi:dihydrofolate reductase